MLFYQCSFVLNFIDRPGKVNISSVLSTCNSVIIAWALLRDENDIPYDVRVRYSYGTKESPITVCKKISGERQKSFARSFQAEFGDLPSDTSVKFFFWALTKNEKTGPATYYTIKTQKLKPSELVDVMLRSESIHYICVGIGKCKTLYGTLQSTYELFVH